MIDIENATETVRLIEQSQLFTAAMGGVFPRELDLSQVLRVLDLGCGPGQWVHQVAFEYQDREVVGVDINTTMIDSAMMFARAQGLDNTSFEIMDLKQPLDFHDASFDLVKARFLVGVLDRVSWPALLAECRRVLAPGGILLLNECEMGVSTSPALQRLGGWLTRALFEQERTFSVDGLTVGMVHMLEPLLQQAGFVATQKRPFVLDGSSDSALYASSFREFEITYALLRPYLIASEVVEPTSYDEQYQHMLMQVRQKDFRSLSFGIRAWGFKP